MTFSSSFINVSPTTTTGCNLCSEGQHTNQSGSSNCLSCNSGQHTNDVGSTSCLTCLVGQWTEGRVGASSCSKCPIGKSGQGCIECSEGTYRGANDDEAKACISCPAGFYQLSSASSDCFQCIPGKYAAHTGATVCGKCPSGYFQPEPKKASCDLAQPGSIVTRGGLSSLVVPKGSKIDALELSGFTACPAGSIGNVPPNEVCKNCPTGTSSTPGATTCQVCDKGKSNGKSGGTCQDCQFNTFQDQNTKPSLSCKTCPSGYSNNATGESSCQDQGFLQLSSCNEFQFLNNTSTSPEDWECVECPFGASCVGDINWDGVYAKFGWSRCHNNDVVFERCTFAGACLGGINPALIGKYFKKDNNIDLAKCNSGNCTARCNTAYVNTSVLCGQCAYDYSHDGLTGRCDRCPELAENIGVAIGGGFLGLLGIFVYIQLTLSDGGRLDESDGAKSIGLSFIQLISLLVTFPIAW